MNNLETARKYFTLGLSIIPVKPNSKMPMVEWKQYQFEKPRLFEIEQWFSNRQVNIGLVTGRVNNLIVVDLDSYKKADPEATELTSPLWATTPRGGKHLYFKYNENIRNSVNSDIAVDIRGEGGFVVIPPSSIADGTYKWNQFPTVSLLESLPELPDSVWKSLQPKQVTEKFDPKTAIGVTNGSRNQKLHDYTCALLNKFNEPDWETLVWETVLGTNQTYQPPLPESEVKAIFQSACKFIKANPKSTTEQIRDWQKKTFKDVVERVAKELTTEAVQGISSGYTLFDAFTNGFFKGQSYLFYGDTNTGKSTIVCNMLIRMAKQGIPVSYFDLENRATQSINRMTLIARDDISTDEWNNLLGTNSIAEYPQILKDLPIELWDLNELEERFGAVTFEGVEKCILEGKQKGIEVFVIDHLHYFEESVTNHNHLAQIAKKINDLAALQDVVMIVVAHTKKGNVYEKEGSVKVKRPTVDSIMGSGLIARHSKNLIALQRNAQSEDPIDRETAYLYVEKTKTGKIGKITLHYNPNNLHFEEI